MTTATHPPIRASELTDSHPELPPGYRTHIGLLRAKGWPDGYRCPACEAPSLLSYRCSRCGADLAGGGQ